jgi:hypothetical protein
MENSIFSTSSSGKIVYKSKDNFTGFYKLNDLQVSLYYKGLSSQKKSEFRILFDHDYKCIESIEALSSDIYPTYWRKIEDLYYHRQNPL